jgi:hypothetical protein
MMNNLNLKISELEPTGNVAVVVDTFRRSFFECHYYAIVQRLDFSFSLVCLLDNWLIL